MIAPISLGLSLSSAPRPGSLTLIWNGAPTWLDGIIAASIMVAGLITQIKPLASALASVVRFLIRRIKLDDRDDAYRITQRQSFARYVESQLDQLAGKEDWRDERFAELEAEVEVEGHEQVLTWLRHSPSRTVTLRREKSLSAALDRSTESLIILEGEPGAGKSVALRHLAHRLARKARKSRSTTSRIPLYVNFKEFNPPRRPVDGEAVREFILASLKRTNDRDVERFLDEEFDRGLREGTWLLLLDSFDEIPDVLSATEATGIVEEYAQAIHDFLHGMKTSRAVVASREFRGPKTFRVPRFTVMPLSTRQQRDLVKRSGLRPESVDAVHIGLSTADSDMQQMAKNPMFLGLICEYVRMVNDFPSNAHMVYESYLQQRFKLDEERIRKRYGIGSDQVRRIAEEAAFSMAAVSGLGLSPGRRQLHLALATAVPISVTQFDKVLDALEYAKVGRSPDDTIGSPDKRFTFAHRRFQEYFATCLVLRDPDRVPAGDLLTSGQWRETTVTILQTQSPDVVAPLLEEAAQLTDTMDSMVAGFAAVEAPGDFHWPSGCLHLLQLIDAGLGRSPGRIPARIRESVGRILRTAWQQGRRYDRKWAADLALVSDSETTLWLVTQAFESGSVLLCGTGYTVVSRMADPPDSLYGGVRQALIDMTASGQLAEERVALKAQIRRLPHPKYLLRAFRLLAEARNILIVLAAIIVVINGFLFWPIVALDMIIFPITLLLFPALLSRLDRLPLTTMLYGMLAMLAVIYLQGVVVVVDNASPARWRLGLALAAFIASSFYGMWPLGVRVASATGRMVTPIAWILTPFYAVLYFLWRAVMSWRRLFRWKVALFLVITLASEGFILYSLNGSPFPFSGISISPDIFALAYFVFMGAAIAFRAWQWRHDRRLVRDLIADAGTADGGVLLRALHDAKTLDGANKILEWACGRDTVGVPGVIRVLSDLSAVVEAGRRDRYAQVPGLGSLVEEWLRADPKRTRRVVRWVRDTTLDRIARVIEQAELTRQIPR